MKNPVPLGFDFASSGQPLHAGLGDLDDGVRPSTPEMLQRAVVGRRIRLLRTRLALSHEEFARAYGFSLNDLIDWERGRALPDESIIGRFETIENEPERIADHDAPGSFSGP